jgi:hypothetical protein
MTPVLVDLLNERVVGIFLAQISGAEQSYVAAMNAHTWKSQQVSAGGGRGTIEGGQAVATGSSLVPPVALLHFLPLSYAMNGILSACNEIRKCATTVAGGRCIRDVLRFLLRIADDVALARNMSQLMDDNEQKGVAEFANAFVHDFVPHVARCLERLFSSVQQLARQLPEEVSARLPSPLLQSTPQVLDPIAA